MTKEKTPQNSGEESSVSYLFTVIFYIALRDFSEVNRLKAERAREAWNAMNYRIMLLMKMEWQQKTALAAVLVNKPAPAPAMGHHRSSEGRLPGKNAPMYDKGARVMNDKGHMGNHNMGNHNNAHKAPNREIAMNTRSNHGGAGHFGGRR